MWKIVKGVSEGIEDAYKKGESHLKDFHKKLEKRIGKNTVFVNEIQQLNFVKGHSGFLLFIISFPKWSFTYSRKSRHYINQKVSLSEASLPVKLYWEREVVLIFR